MADVRSGRQEARFEEKEGEEAQEGLSGGGDHSRTDSEEALTTKDLFAPRSYQCPDAALSLRTVCLRICDFLISAHGSYLFYEDDVESAARVYRVLKVPNFGLYFLIFAPILNTPVDGLEESGVSLLRRKPYKVTSVHI
uniref:Mlh1_C domain-containing protein n=1 Tax=Steinernema glaseri TaxID=37863 RepID=A0A1I7YD52_9BILA